VLRQKYWKQKDLAVKLGVTEAWIFRLLNNPTNMSIFKIVEVAMALGLEIELTLNNPNPSRITLQTTLPLPVRLHSTVEPGT
jgi:transcriptional regulator with XRE-family HTH domain